MHADIILYGRQGVGKTTIGRYLKDLGLHVLETTDPAEALRISDVTRAPVITIAAVYAPLLGLGVLP